MSRYLLQLFLASVVLHAGFAAQSLLSALGSVQFVSNVFFAKFVLHEKVRISKFCLTKLSLLEVSHCL